MAVFAQLATALALLLTVTALRPLWRSAPRPALALSLLVVLGTAGLYRLLGTPDALDPRNVETPRDLAQAIDQLERRLQREPDEVEGWVLLGRSRLAQGDAGKALAAYARAESLQPDDADLLVEIANTELRAAADHRISDSARQRLERAVQLQPRHQRGLFLLGMSRLQDGKPAESVSLWERLLPTLEPAAAEALRPQIAAARARAGLPPAPAIAVAPHLQVEVVLDPALVAQLPAEAQLFVFARRIDGAGPPLAVKRVPAQGFPVTLSLSDADGLMPTQRLFSQTRVQLMARVSRSGEALAAAGDLEATPLEIELHDGAQAQLRIARIHP